MNKQDIFPLYVGKCKILTNTGRTRSFHGIDDLRQTDPVIFPDCLPVSRCQLILKRISDMSEGDMNLLCDYLNLQDNKPIAYVNVEYINRYIKCQNVYMNLVTANRIFAWLIEHGYALSDEWFTNGIAVEG